MEDLTLKLGLLMEAAQGQQAVAATALEGLRAHTAGLDAVVRDEIRATLVAEFRELHQDTQRAAQALARLRRVAGLRTVLWSALLSVTTVVVPLTLGRVLLPSPAQVEALRATRAGLEASVERLRQAGGRVDLRKCGATRRLCVRVDRQAPAYGEAGDYRVVQGY
ncbi:MAG: hypothetical protein JSR67_10795 [Proteobacteria bacterium]|nr:hypothetical protein [Pseudomonadota bacterium]